MFTKHGLKAKATVAIILLSIFAVGFYPTANSIATSHGQYQPLLGFTYCDPDPWICWHELGHLMDDKLGDPSKSYEFGIAMRAYLFVQIKYSNGADEYTNTILSMPGIIGYTDAFSQPFNFGSGSSPQQEAYASIFATAGGDISKMPAVFQPFYENNPEKYKAMHEYLMRYHYMFIWESIYYEN